MGPCLKQPQKSVLTAFAKENAIPEKKFTIIKKYEYKPWQRKDKNTS